MLVASARFSVVRWKGKGVAVVRVVKARRRVGRCILY
jgi:hypothetical protein